MITKRSAPPGTKLTSLEYSFLKPARLRIRSADGVETLMGYGIGERISVLEPAVQYLIASYEVLDEVPLADGGHIIEWPADLKVQRA